MERKRFRLALTIAAGASGLALIGGGVYLVADGSNGSNPDGNVFNPNSPTASQTLDGTVIPGAEPTPTPTRTPRPGELGYTETASPTAISISQSLRPTDIWTPPGTIWVTQPPTEPPTEPPYWTPAPTIPPTVIWTPEPTQPPTAPPTPEPTAPVIEGPNYEWVSQLTNLINQERLNNGLNALNFNQALSSAGLEFAEFMIKNDVYGHGVDGLQPYERAENHGYIGEVGENLALAQSADSIIQGWLSSPTHRAQILAQQWNDIGIGCYQGDFNGSFGTICAAEFGHQ